MGLGHINELLKLPWFTRLWALQEAVLAKDAIFVYGEHTIKYKTLYGYYLALSALTSENDHIERLYYEINRVMVPYMMASQAIKFNEVRMFCFSITRLLKTSEPKDGVFALQGLLQTLGMSVPDPDYTRPYSTVYRETFRVVLEAGRDNGTLKELSFCNMKKPTPGFPSWVPDPTSPRFLNKTAYYMPMKFPVLEKPNLHFSQDGLRLHCQGLRVSIVRTCSSTSLVDTWSGNNLHEIKGEEYVQALKGGDSHLAQLSGRLWNVYVFGALITYAIQDCPAVGEEAFKAIYYCLKQGMPIGGDRLAKEYAAFKRWAQILTSSDNDEAPQQVGTSPFDSMYDDRIVGSRQNPAYLALRKTEEFRLLNKIGLENDVTLWHELVEDVTHEGTFFVTETGKLGYGSFPIQAGDVVVHLCGGQTPFILRSLDGRYKIVSSAHIHDYEEDIVSADNLEEFTIA